MGLLDHSSITLMDLRRACRKVDGPFVVQAGKELTWKQKDYRKAASRPLTEREDRPTNAPRSEHKTQPSFC